jgi:hypothetical protein
MATIILLRLFKTERWVIRVWCNHAIKYWAKTKSAAVQVLSRFVHGVTASLSAVTSHNSLQNELEVTKTARASWQRHHPRGSQQHFLFIVLSLLSSSIPIFLLFLPSLAARKPAVILFLSHCVLSLLVPKVGWGTHTSSRERQIHIYTVTKTGGTGRQGAN